MFETIFSAQKKLKTETSVQKKRRHIRRACDQCVSQINDQIYPVENWSAGGLVIKGDSRAFGIDNIINITMKFKLHNRMIDIPQRAKVIRKTRDKIAFEFMPLSKDTQNKFQSVVDDYVTRQFADSQLS